MPSLSDLPGNLNRKKLAKALERLGFDISTKGGKGSHFKTTHINSQKSITIPSNTDKYVLKYVLDEIEKYSGITWEEIKREL